MYCVIVCEDKGASVDLRVKTRPHHLQYLEPYRDRILFAGGLLKDDEDTAIGGLMVVDLAGLDSALSFARNDPYSVAGLFSRRPSMAQGIPG